MFSRILGCKECYSLGMKSPGLKPGIWKPKLKTALYLPVQLHTRQKYLPHLLILVHKLPNFSNFTFDLEYIWNWSFFHYEKLQYLTQVLSYKSSATYLERPIIIGVTRLFS